MVQNSSNPLFNAKLPPPLSILIKTATIKNYFFFLIFSIFPILLLYLIPTILYDIPSLVIFLAFFSLSLYTLLKVSGFYNVILLYNAIHKKRNLYDINGYLSILPIFTIVPRHIEGGVDIYHLFIFNNPYDAINNNFIYKDIVSNGFNIYNSHDKIMFDPIAILQPYSNKDILKLEIGQPVRFIGNKKFGFIFTSKNIIWLKGKNILTNDSNI
jgi:hypothetical protein